VSVIQQCSVLVLYWKGRNLVRIKNTNCSVIRLCRCVELMPYFYQLSSVVLCLTFSVPVGNNGEYLKNAITPRNFNNLDEMCVTHGQQQSPSPKKFLKSKFTFSVLVFLKKNWRRFFREIFRICGYSNCSHCVFVRLGSVSKFGCGKGGKYLQILGWVHGPRHLAAIVYNAHWQFYPDGCF